MPDNITRTSLDQNIKSEKPEREKQASVVATPAKPKKKSLWQEIKEQFIAEDGKTVTEYIAKDVVVPLVKGMIQSVVNTAVDMMLYGGGGNPNYRNNVSGYRSNNVSYKPYYDQRNSSNNNSYYSKPRTNYGYEYNEIVFESRADAEAVFYRMMEIINAYGVVRVADYLEISGRESNYTDNNYGWPSLEGVQIRRARDGGYFLDLQRPMPID